MGVPVWPLEGRGGKEYERKKAVVNCVVHEERVRFVDSYGNFWITYLPLEE